MFTNVNLFHLNNIVMTFYTLTWANFTNRLRLSQLSLCIRFKPKNRFKSVCEIGTWKKHKYCRVKAMEFWKSTNIS